MKITPLKDLKEQVDIMIEDIGETLVRSRSQRKKRTMESTLRFAKSVKHYLNQVQ